MGAARRPSDQRRAALSCRWVWQARCGAVIVKGDGGRRYSIARGLQCFVHCSLCGARACSALPRAGIWCERQPSRARWSLPLQSAVMGGHEHVVRCLLASCGADVNHVGENGTTALYAASLEGHEHMVRCLVTEFGADVNQVSKNGSTALYGAAQKGHEHVVRCLVKNSVSTSTKSWRITPRP
jgi:hypothetical protein